MAQSKYTAVMRRPTFDIRFVTENSEFHIVHDTSLDLTNQFMTESVINMTTTNSMEDDSSAFSIVVAGDMEWDKLLNANDLVILKIKPNEEVPIGIDARPDEPTRDVVMLGLVSEVRIEATHDDDTKMYRITGQSFAKAFIQFELNSVRQVTYSPVGGWLNTNSQAGVQFHEELVGGTVAEVVEAMYDRFVQYMRYDFRYLGDGEGEESNNLDLSTRIRTQFYSWKGDESLHDPTPFLNFEGSFNQLLNEVVTRPFCEMFFDVWSDEEGNEQALFTVRRTPFDEPDWKRLKRHTLRSRDVKTEDLAQSDLDVYAVFNVYPESDMLVSTSSFVQPKYHPKLVNKYGYKMMEVTHRFLSSVQAPTEDRGEGEPTAEGLSIDQYNNAYDELMTLMDTENPDAMSQVLRAMYGIDVNVDALSDFMQEFPGKLEPGASESRLVDITDAPTITGGEALGDGTPPTELIEKYSEKLYNWYANNPNFFAGDIQVVGHPDYRLGNRLLYINEEENDIWEFYIESVEHNFSYEEGYTTTLGVTRGLRMENKDDYTNRFNPPVGEAQDFAGGYFGEMSIKEAQMQAASGMGDVNQRGGHYNPDDLYLPVTGKVTSPYGMRTHPIHGDRRMHNGVDIAGGSKLINAMASGTVVTSTYHSSAGNFVEIDHGNLQGRGNVSSRYLHLKNPGISAGTEVRAGQQIGIMGTTGSSTGVHLHFEILVNGNTIDPEEWFPGAWR